MKINQSIFLTLTLIMLCSSSAHSAISFTDGKWETTFNCDEQTQAEWSLDCDGIEWWLNYELVPGKETLVTSVANNASGGGGRGVQFWKGEGQNNDTGALRVAFPTPQPEMWIRWYQRNQSGYAWEGGLPEDDKIFFIKTGVPLPETIVEFYQGRYDIVAQGTSNYRQVYTDNYGWDDVMGGSTGDGQWHCYEIHLKMDTDGSNGIGQIWIDGVLRESNTAVDWSNSNATAQQGWTYFIFEENQKYVSGGPYSVDYDDMVIYNTTPPNIDDDSNAFIGPIGYVPAVPPLLGGSVVGGQIVQ